MVLDASVWVAALIKNERHHAESASFLMLADDLLFDVRATLNWVTRAAAPLYLG